MVNNEKVDFVKKRYPNLKNVNPYFDYEFIKEVKEALTDHGFYVASSKHLYNDTSITNIILRAQGKKIANRRTASRTLK